MNAHRYVVEQSIDCWLSPYGIFGIQLWHSGLLQANFGGTNGCLGNAENSHLRYCRKIEFSKLNFVGWAWQKNSERVPVQQNLLQSIFKNFLVAQKRYTSKSSAFPGHRTHTAGCMSVRRDRNLS